MTEKRGKTYVLEGRTTILAGAGVVGQNEGEGPLGNEFDFVEDASGGADSWESAESVFHKKAVDTALKKSGRSIQEIDLLLSGDLLNQSMGSSFSVRDMDVSFCGLFGACSTMALSLGLASLLIDSGVIDTAVAATSSHFCSAEKQFRQPLEYGGQRPPTAQRTVTGAGAMVLEAAEHYKGSLNAGRNPHVSAVRLGRIVDYGVTDENNMGAAMAPAAMDTIWGFLEDTGTKPSDYDLILTGDLGYTGSDLLKKLLVKEKGCDISDVHDDCGMLIFDRENQDVHSGGSGCGCSASVLCTHILRRMYDGELARVLFVGTGALVSTVSPLQGESVPGIAHAVLIEM